MTVCACISHQCSGKVLQNENYVHEEIRAEETEGGESDFMRSFVVRMIKLEQMSN
jgi:hypothetical protein